MAVNAIDFSDLTKKPKPQGFQTPPPQPQLNTQLGVKNPDWHCRTIYGLSCKSDGSR